MRKKGTKFHGDFLLINNNETKIPQQNSQIGLLTPVYNIQHNQQQQYDYNMQMQLWLNYIKNMNPFCHPHIAVFVYLSVKVTNKSNFFILAKIC